MCACRLRARRFQGFHAVATGGAPLEGLPAFYPSWPWYSQIVVSALKLQQSESKFGSMTETCGCHNNQQHSRIDSYDRPLKSHFRGASNLHSRIPFPKAEASPHCGRPPIPFLLTIFFCVVHNTFSTRANPSLSRTARIGSQISFV